ncbi:MAG: citrate transporter [Gammaproteobacteria bacterium]|nr:citrate transporter [Gammaproteobacteria bacterium]
MTTPLPAAAGVELFGVPLEFVLFALTLLGVATLHHRTLEVAVTGLVTIALYKIALTGFHEGSGLAGFAGHLRAEWVVLANLFGLLMGFALLSRHFEESHVPAKLPDYLPDDWRGGFALLVMVFVLSSFLDNIAAALIGGTVAATVFRHKVHIGYVAALVAASNAGGSGSVVGDTTTTMMWIDGVSPLNVVHAYVAAGVAVVVCGVPAALQQQAYSPIVRHSSRRMHVDWSRVAVVATILLAAIVVNVVTNLRFPEYSDRFPFLGAAVWTAILATAAWRRPDWSVMPSTLRGTCFLLSLVLAASMMPVERLPAASWLSALGLGFVSAVFDNIPLTKLALEQGGYDWGVLAYAVGFGGSMIWFGSSAGVAITNLFPEARSVGGWLRGGWHVAVAYVVGFAAVMLVMGWHPHAPHKGVPVAEPVATVQSLRGSP